MFRRVARRLASLGPGVKHGIAPPKGHHQTEACRCVFASDRPPLQLASAGLPAAVRPLANHKVAGSSPVTRAQVSRITARPVLSKKLREGDLTRLRE
jgi:hypothetical protein